MNLNKKEDSGRHRKMWAAFGATLAVVLAVLVFQVRSALHRAASFDVGAVESGVSVAEDELEAILGAQSPALQASFHSAVEETAIYFAEQQAVDTLSESLK